MEGCGDRAEIDEIGKPEETYEKPLPAERTDLLVLLDSPFAGQVTNNSQRVSRLGRTVAVPPKLRVTLQVPLQRRYAASSLEVAGSPSMVTSSSAIS